MKYINLDNFYMLDDFDKFLKANPYKDYSQEKLEFRESDIAFVRLKHYKPLSQNHSEVEIHNKKEFFADENFFVISDSPLNIIFKMMEYKKFDEFDMMPILRLKHIQKMIDCLKQEPNDLSNKQGFLNSLWNFKTEYLALFFNEEKQELLADYLILDKNNLKENVFKNYEERGFSPIYFETKKDTQLLYKEFLNIFSGKSKVSQSNIYIHPYNSIGGKPYTDFEKDALQNRFVALKAELIQEFNKLRENLLNNKITLPNCINTFEVRGEIFIENNEIYAEFKKKYCFEMNIQAMINLLCLGEYSWEKLNEMQLIHSRTLKELDELPNHQEEYLRLIQETIEEFKKQAGNGFKD